MTPTTTPTTPRGTAAITPPPTRAVGLAFGAAIALSAFLLFQVQPLIGKYILPWFGGSAGVWTTCMLFFQMLLLAGYLYAHLSVTYLPPRAQAALHAALLLAAALLTLPIIPSDRWKPVDADQPVRHILLLLLATLGLPYFALSATAPLLQRWFARLSPARSPYRLYALSNVASLAALLTFPFLVEPLLSRRAQAWTWSAGYLGFAACLCACAVMLWRNAPSPAHGPPDQRTSDAAPAGTPFAHYVLWLALPACASLLFLAVTNKLCMEVAAVPFLWIIPLAIYLLTFIIAFDSPRWYRRALFGPLLAVALGVAAYALHAGDQWHLVAQIALYAAVLFIACMVCHGELVALKPDPSRLTAFYLSSAAGGALGGLSVGVLAPLLFDRFLEIHVGLALTWILFLAALASDPKSPLHAFRRAGVWYLLVIAGVLLVVGLYAEVALRRAEVDDVARDRNFYGVLHVHHAADEAGAPVLILQHNNIVHGTQFTDEARRMEPTAYFRRTSGIGRILAAPRPPGEPARRVGIVGLGIGTLAAYGNPGDRFRFYELDVAVEHFARTYFTFISGSRAAVEVIPGDGRLSMEREPPQEYDLLALDAFTGDAVPVHLLTREAFATYLRHTTAAGVIAMNISNDHVDLLPVVEALAAHFSLDHVYVHDQTSLWALLAKQPQSLDPARPFASKPTDPRPTTLWTDDYASMFQVLKWRRE